MSIPELNLYDLNGRNGYRIVLEVGQYHFPDVASAGDVNGDGLADIIIGHPGSKPFYAFESTAGSSYVLYGSTDIPESNYRAEGDYQDSIVDAGVGSHLPLSISKARYGASVASIGDFNGDGFDDVVVGAPEFEHGLGRSTGAAFVRFGQADHFGGERMNDLDGTNGFRLNGIDAGDKAGRFVASAGDVNGDGFDDLFISAPGGDADGAPNVGEAYVVFGTDVAMSAVMSLADLDGTNGFQLQGNQSISALASAGDLNGDGYDDLVIGAPRLKNEDQDEVGGAYVVFGSAGGFEAQVSLEDLDGTNGFRFVGTYALAFAGVEVSSAGDVNGDGFDDLIIGGYYFHDLVLGRIQAPAAVLLGTDTGFAPVITADDLDGANGFQLGRRTPGNATSVGTDVSSAGDVNGDGYDDLLIGDPQSERAWVYFGQQTFGDGRLDIENGGFQIVGHSNQTGNSVSGAGDMNGDGYDDLIISAVDRIENYPSAQFHESYAYVVYGGPNGFIDLFARGDAGDNWLSLPSDWEQGTAGIDGGRGTDMMSFAGLDAPVYVNLATGRAASVASTASFDLVMRGIENVTGTSHADIFVGGDASEWIRGLGGHDTIYARGVAADRYDGGSGADTLSFVYASSGVAVSLLRGTGYSGEARGDMVQGVEHLTGSFHDDILWGDHGANKLFGGAGDDLIIGNGGDDFISGGYGTDTVLYAGNQADYQIRQEGNAIWVTDLSSATGTDLIGNVEILRFADGDLLL